MGRQERRRHMRHSDSKIRWDIIAIYAVLAFFALTALFSYLFPQINARAYASSARVQKVIVTRGLNAIANKTPLEFVYSYSAEKVDDTIQYQVKEEAGKVTLTDAEDKVSTEYAAAEVPEAYKTVASTIADVRAALKNKDFKISYNAENDGAGYKMLVLLNQVTTTDYEAYALYFTENHALDIIHYYKASGENKLQQRVYGGLTTGIPEETPAEQ